MTGMQPRTVERARTVAQMQRAGYTQNVIAHHLGVTPRTVARLHTTSKTLTEETPMASIRGWDKQAACRREDPELFFPPTYYDSPAIAEAKSICHACPVLNRCRTYALDNPDKTPDGIWGALTPQDRRRARLGRTAA